jgi:ribonuclease Z
MESGRRIGGMMHTSRRLRVWGVFAVFAVGILVGWWLTADGGHLGSEAVAREAGGSRGLTAADEATLMDAAVGLAEPRGMYFPGTEKLRPDEMRIVACGTGMPSARISQAATCWLVELGNGDKFLFDIGAGSSRNVASLNIPYDLMDKIFISHLHVDHFGDLPTHWLGGWTAGRHGALRIWGPSGATPELGTKYSIERMKESYDWDVTARLGVIPTAGAGLEVHEFDYRQLNEVVYQENGVTIRSWPAIHCIDGCVSFSLEWNGLKFVFGGDTVPNQWYIKYAKNADFAIHESFIPPQLMMDKWNFSAQSALNAATVIHTPPAAFGKVMSMVKPRMAVAYHFFDDPDTRYPIYEGIRQIYDGPLTMATDLLVWNVTKDDITVRSAIVDPRSWPVPSPLPPDDPDPSLVTPFSEEMEAGKLDVAHTFADLVEEFKRKNNLE